MHLSSKTKKTSASDKPMSACEADCFSHGAQCKCSVCSYSAPLKKCVSHYIKAAIQPKPSSSPNLMIKLADLVSRNIHRLRYP